MNDNAKLPSLEIDALGYWMDRSFRAMIKTLNESLKEANLDLQHSQFVVLRRLSVKDGAGQSELSKILGKNPAAISRSVNYLETKGFVRREPATCCKYRVFLTEAGKKLVPKLIEIDDRITEKALTGFSDKEKKEVKDILNKIYRNSLT